MMNSLALLFAGRRLNVVRGKSVKSTASTIASKIRTVGYKVGKVYSFRDWHDSYPAFQKVFKVFIQWFFFFFCDREYWFSEFQRDRTSVFDDFVLVNCRLELRVVRYCIKYWTKKYFCSLRTRSAIVKSVIDLYYDEILLLFYHDNFTPPLSSRTNCLN